MRRRITAGAAFLLAAWICATALLPARAQQEFCFELLAGGRNTAEVFEGDTLELTVTLRLPEQQQTAQLYALQNELDFDASMLELVAGSVKAAPGFDAGVSLLEDGASWRMIVSRM